MSKFNNRGMSTVVTIIIITVLVIVVGALLFINSINTKDNSSVDQGNQIYAEPPEEGWKIYQNNDYKFAFQHPKDKMFFLSEPKQYHGYCSTIEREDDCILYSDLMESDIEGLPVYQGIMTIVVNRALDDQLIHKYDEMPMVGQMVDIAEEISIGGKTGYKFDLITATNYKIRSFMIPLDGDNSLEVSEGSKYPITTAEDWEKMISTFRFL
jgi:PII-like signaling protein